MKNSKTLHALILTVGLIFIGAGLASALTISIMPSKDNTLYDYDPAEGDHSNGAGFHFFAGVTSMSELRRGVLAFDIAGSIPPGSTITVPTGGRERLTHLERKVTEHRPPLTMPHGGTVSSTPFFGPCKAATFPPQ